MNELVYRNLSEDAKRQICAWKLVNPMAYFNSLNEVSIPHLK